MWACVPGMVEVVVSSVPRCGCGPVVVAGVSGFWMVEVVVSSVPPSKCFWVFFGWWRWLFLVSPLPPVDVGLWLLLVNVSEGFSDGGGGCF